MLVTSTKIAGLLDGGQYRNAEGALARSRIQDDLVALILQADIEIYFARLEEGAGLLAEVSEKLNALPLEAAARYALAKGTLHYWRYEYEAAEVEFDGAQQLCRLLGNRFQSARCLWELGRIKRRRGEYQAAEGFTSRARDLIKDDAAEHIERFEFLSGLLDLNSAICHHQLGDLDRACELYVTSTELLRRSEEGRYYGCALNSYGSLLVRLGRYEEAFEALQTSNRVCTEMAILEDISHAKSNLAWAMLRQGQFAESEEMLKEAIELGQRVGDIPGTAIRLELLGELYLAKGDFVGAKRHIDSAIEQADLGDHDYQKGYSRITAGRILLAQRDTRNAEKMLTRALEIGEKIQSIPLIARSCLYLSEVYLSISTVRGQEFLGRASELLADYRDVVMENDLKRISGRYRGERIVVTSENKLTINGHLLPTWNAAKEAVERFLLKNALAQAGDNQAKAGEILGISKVHVHDKRKQYGL
ncbi:MAG: tetratricopeptide repeat protein [Acidobacteria bacterium]|nr:tetratricopeptide repeat protein [Acidobacteriota bacterium]